MARLEAEGCTNVCLGLGKSAAHPARLSLNEAKGLVCKDPQLQNFVSYFRRGALWCQPAHDANLVEVEWTTQKDHWASLC